MSQLSRKEYLAKMRWRYALRGREGKSRLLDELCEVCGYDCKYAIKLLGGKPIWLSSEMVPRPLPISS